MPELQHSDLVMPAIVDEIHRQLLDVGVAESSRKSKLPGGFVGAVPRRAKELLALASENV